jgi:polyribonucleotide nucleotidyltransferase
VVRVKVLETDDKGRVKLSMKALADRPEGMPEREPREPRGDRPPREDRGGYRGDRGDRGGDRGDRGGDRPPREPREAREPREPQREPAPTLQESGTGTPEGGNQQ